MSKLQKVIKRLATNTLDQDEAVTMAGFKVLLENEGFEFTLEDFKSNVKPIIQAEFARLNGVESSDVEILAPRKNSAPSKRHDNKAAKNLATFMSAMSGSSRMLPAEEEDEERDDEDEEFESVAEEEEEDEAEFSESEVEEVQTKSKGKKRVSVTKSTKTKSEKITKGKISENNSSTATDFKSAQFINTSDDDSNSPQKKQKLNSNEKEEEEEEEIEILESKSKKSKSKPKKATPGEGKSTTPEKKVKKDDLKGSQEEETKIKQMKSLLSAAGNSRPFTVKTGSEKLLTVTERLALLTSLLIKVGLKISPSGGLPSMKSAKELGEKIALEKETQSLVGTPKLKGLRDGKVLKVDSELEEDSDKNGRSIKPKGKFSSFLGDQSSDSD